MLARLRYLAAGARFRSRAVAGRTPNVGRPLARAADELGVTVHVPEVQSYRHPSHEPEEADMPAANDAVGTINVVDPHPLNWLYITWNTMEEPVRTDEKGHLANSAMEDAHWVDDTTIEIKLREGIVFQDGTPFGSGNFERAFVETQKWKAPHPPGTYLNFHPETELEVVDAHTVRMKFPVADGLVLGKFRGFHLPSDKFWDELGFGYKTLGTGEGHW